MFYGYWTLIVQLNIICFHTIKLSKFYFKQVSLTQVICLHTDWESNISLWPINGILSGTTTPGQNEPGSHGIESVLHILQSFSITRASPSDGLMLYAGHSLVGSYPSAEM